VRYDTKAEDTRGSEEQRCLKPGHSGVVRHRSWFPHGATWLPILLAWRFFALQSKDDEGVEKICVFDLVVQNI